MRMIRSLKHLPLIVGYVPNPNETPNAKLAIFWVLDSYTNATGCVLDVVRGVLAFGRLGGSLGLNICHS